MRVLDVLKKRYAVKLFTGKKIKNSDIVKMKEVIKLAPSSFNLQPWKIKIVSDKNLLKKLEIASFNQPQISSASHLFVFCSTNSFKENEEKLINSIKKNKPHNVEIFSKRLKEFTNRMSKEDKRRLSERELFMALENLIMITTDLGYGACPIGGFDSKKFKQILSIPKEFEPVVLCAVGIPKDTPRKKFRFENKDIFLE